MTRPFSVKMFLANGTPEGLRIVEKDNWNGCGVVCPRPLLKDSQSRLEFHKAGVYLLLGESDEDDLPLVYIGEADPIGERLKSHDAEKDFWTRVVFFVGNLHKAHIQHLESKLYLLAQNAKRCKLQNRNQPTLPTLSEAEIAHSDGFLDEMLLCLGVLGVAVFDQPANQPTTQPQREFMTLSAKDIQAKGYVSASGFVVCKNSKAIHKSSDYLQESAKVRREKLIELGVLKLTGNHYVFTQDYEFGSPSTAGQVILGRSTNGRSEWKDSQNRSLNDIAKLNNQTLS
jgi:hypothetical protein